MRTCKMCNTAKEDDQFYKSSSGKPTGPCKPCNAIKSKMW